MRWVGNGAGKPWRGGWAMVHENHFATGARWCGETTAWQVAMVHENHSAMGGRWCGKPTAAGGQWCMKTTMRRVGDSARTPWLSGETTGWRVSDGAGESRRDIPTMVLEYQDRARGRLCSKTTARWVSNVGLEVGDGAVKPQPGESEMVLRPGRSVLVLENHGRAGGRWCRKTTGGKVDGVSPKSR